ncbi:hypothetical protein NKW55_07895 [Gluconobacter kondonii]|uniref:hypothetical protein n=1 Tax=Gluconobacter kondonii TaxID=941463 RepID=UPI00209EE443|nr:hypothetical protein [Gluconobacter kondonii]MCP1236530.1 hypothetical protein [Gluconobacter kondonii]
MPQLASDPALTQTSVQATDLLVFLRPVQNSQGVITGYAPCNITASDFAASILSLGLLAIGPTLPDTAPVGGGWYLNAGALSYSPLTGSESGAILTNAAMSASYAAWVASLPVADPGTGPGTFWNNSGVATESVAT